MGFGRKSEDDTDEPNGDWKVDQVPIVLSGKKLLQASLDRHQAEGWQFVQAIYSEKHDFVLVIYKRA